ncbi:MAG: helix-turn-helix transcriptional regulator [Egibacteraceae bacterium]
MSFRECQKFALPGEVRGLIGRRAELGALERALHALASGSAGVVLVAGEPGIGKTRLLAELCARGEESHCLVLAGRAAEFERDLPFGVFVAALDDYLASLDPVGLEVLGPQRAVELAGLFPSLAMLAGGTGLGGLPVERHRAYRAVRALLEELSRPQPLLLVLDDLHWADPASVELVCHLLAHQPQSPVLLALALRPAQTSLRLAAALDATAREGTAEHIELGPLTADEAEELVGPGVDRATREECYRHSGGNPFYLQQLMRGDSRRRVVRAGALAGSDANGVPAPVRAALASELDHLSERARMMLWGAAVAGDPFEPGLAAQTAGVGEAEALVALDELLEFDLVRPTAVPRRFRFRHPIVRRAVYESTGAGWRLGAHARAAAALAAQGASASARAHHVELSAKAGDEAAIALLVEAGEVTAPRAPATAARWFAAALRLMTDEHGVQQRLELLVALATALGSAGQLEDSRLALCQALELSVPGCVALRVRLVALCAGVERLLGRHQDAHARLMGALRGMDDDRCPEAVALTIELAVDALYASDLTSARVWAEQACAAAQALDDRSLAVTAAGALALVEYALGDTGSAGAHLDEAAALFDELADDELAVRLDAAYYVGWAEFFMERFDDAVRHLERGVVVSRATGQGHLLVPMTLGQVFALSIRGELAQAGELADAAVEAARLSANAQSLSWALWARCSVHTLSGDLPAAVAAGTESVELASTLDPSLLSATSGSVLAPVLLEVGEAQRCRAELLAALDGPDLPLAVPVVRCISYELLTRAELALGRVEAAEEWARRAEAAAGGLDLPVTTGLARRAQAAVLLESGRPRPAAQLALAAAEAAEAAGARVEAARSRVLAGRALVQSGDRKAAFVELERAEAELGACGARGYRDQAARELRRLGRRVRRSRNGAGAAGVESLTARELEVVELVATGKTNRAIAAALYISEKTVETHLSHVFTKLGVSSRAAVAGIITHYQQGPRP